MEEKIIAFETAKLLKEENIVLDYFYHYNKNGVLIENSINNRQHVCTHNLFANNTDFELDRWGGGTIDSLCAPTQSLLQKWLREIHGVFIGIDCFKGKYRYHVYNVDAFNSKYPKYKGVEETCMYELGTEAFTFESYEDALEKGLIESLNFIKLNK